MKKKAVTKKVTRKSSSKETLPKPLTKARIKRILFPVDFSSFSEEALAYAQPIAKAFNARIDVVYADETNYGEIAAFGPIDVGLLRGQYSDESNKRIKELAQSLRKSGFKSSGTLRAGRAHYVITEVAKEQKTDLIVIATHGHSGLEHLLMGSTAENVVRHATCPVLSVRPTDNR
jgi:universal stress protein A